MILSNIEIQKAIDHKRLIIDPEPLPRIPEIGVTYCPYDTHAVDLRLYHEITVPRSGELIYDLAQSEALSEFIARNSEKYVLSEQQPYRLKRNEFILARTIETVGLPITNKDINLSARIEGKSSRARCGILVHFTAPTVHPGFHGSLTLEVINLGPADFMLIPGMPIAQLIVEEVRGEIFENPSQFQNQSTPEGTNP